MKKILLYTTILLTITFSGCKKYLEQPPDNRTELDLPKKVAQLLGTAYPQANYQGFLESSSDNVADKGVGESRIFNADGYRFEDIGDDQQDTPEGYWAAAYTAIAAKHAALHLTRAIMMHNVVKRW
jgi:starch-binding outer membrane protein, SusD/RagB family